MERVQPEPFRLEGPSFADVLVGREAFEGLQSASEVVGSHEVGEVLPELVMALVVVAPDGRVLDGPVHPLDLAIGPGVTRLGQAMIHIVLSAGEFESMRAEEKACARKSSPRAMASLMSGAAEAVLPGVVKGVPLSGSTVWTR